MIPKSMSSTPIRTGSRFPPARSRGTARSCGRCFGGRRQVGKDHVQTVPHMPRASRAARNGGRPASRILRCRALDVIGHAQVGERARGVVIERVAGGGIAVARLADRADHRDPAALPGERHRDVRRPDRSRRRLPVADEVKHRRHMGVAAERQGRVGRLQAARRGGYVDDIVPARRRGGAGMDIEAGRRPRP